MYSTLDEMMRDLNCNEEKDYYENKENLHEKKLIRPRKSRRTSKTSDGDTMLLVDITAKFLKDIEKRESKKSNQVNFFKG
jgi:hypothetical protein